ncbi:MAG TPA: electron transfer flavoprotein subunit alpha/FixB family protein [Deltaproteobacteria bacterium]|nr:electron transfer flavoprotein subunit alpha/FixB family protein [Deltaproteobacteria bacterium]
MRNILIYSDNTDYACELLTAAHTIAGEIGYGVTALTINNDDQAEKLALRCGTIYRIRDEAILMADAAAVALVISEVAKKKNAPVVLLSSNRRGKEISGRLAHLTHGGCLTDVSGMTIDNGRLCCRRNTLGGATVVTQAIESDHKVIAVVPKVYDTMEEGEKGAITDIAVEAELSVIKVVEVMPKVKDSVDIEAAEVLVVVGQGMGSRDDLPIVEILAGHLKGAVACTKPVATDKRWLSEERIVGLSGRKCKPDLALLLGVSGQVQFVVGIRDAKTIISVNTDENAPIMTMSDYRMVADMKSVVPELVRAIERL